ncbi:MAG TPA: hypothetical protein RMH99_02090 [Sandaracinaceae bacterium LLY-WYZ-13_1]|nr:hypothetical protein [Sandaracinaceae bacterium LLY-WYZ-13_1]
MSRSIIPAAWLSLLVASPALAQRTAEDTEDEALLAAATPAAAELAPTAEEPAPVEEAPVEEDEVLYDEEVEFCGGGEESVVDLASYELEDAPAVARRMLVRALRRGAVDEWQRPWALSTLAEAQLRLGRPRRAILNYREALRLAPSDLGSHARVGLATAYYLAGARDRAHAEAAGVVDEVCASRWSQVPCYGARRIVALTARGEASHQAAEAAARVRASHPRWADGFDVIDARLGVPAPRSAGRV